MEQKAAALKHAFASRQAMVRYLEAPQLDDDLNKAENRRVRIINWIS